MLKNNEKKVRVGIGVFIFKNKNFLMGKRIGSHGSNQWSVPGGHLEFGETIEETAKREVLEETGLEITNIRFGAVTNDFFRQEDKHYVTIWVLSDYKSGEAKIMEPNKCTEQDWFNFEKLPEPLFTPWENLLKSEFIEKIKKETQ